ncbi:MULTISPECIES: hypothetical protein [unclassified Gemella]|uniref:hypothetical protein n=1 Tax=unclassified Gemella TaxID=2624949 RepID=UPI001C057986|nr:MULTISPECIES: hypothetical protein [unclassified Gemella]MBU0278109.1 hypothetical protein [Gemella sp. zg-1178]QWQ38366.1 hypothetical protein KMP11_05240 [Gemella sp. zg-570]
MSVWVILFLVFGILQFITENYKKNKYTKNKKIKNKIKKQYNKVDKPKELLNFSKATNSKKRRQIIDRENEIFAPEFVISKESLVQDFIFSEILDKPKSKK